MSGSKLRLHSNPILNYIYIRHHVWTNLMHCYDCRGRNDFFHQTGFLMGWAVSSSCRKCLKAQSDAIATCQKCGFHGPRGQAYFLKYPDCGPGGMDEEFFACKACADEYAGMKKRIISKMNIKLEEES